MGDRGVPTAAELDHAYEIADRIWWVGSYVPGDPFQCHVFLVEHGDQSVLFDPGGRLTFPAVRRKVEEVVPFDHVRWFVCHHQDPDITASLPLIDDLVTRDDAAIVTHWRAAALVKHYDLRLPFHLVDQNDWELDLGGRRLTFHFTPYLHFPGAFTTFDELTGTLFSSDLFGGFTEEWQFYANDESYFESMRPFHEHYMPSREILAHGLEPLAELPITLIAPQHGELIPEELVATMFHRLQNLDCGLYMMVHRDTDILRLSAMNRLLRNTLQHLVVSRDFNDVASGLMDAARQVFPANALEFYARDNDGDVLWFAPENRYHGTPTDIPREWRPLLDAEKRPDGSGFFHATDGDAPSLAMALFSPEIPRSTGVAVLHLDAPVLLHEATRVALERLAEPLEVALEREVLQRTLEAQRSRFHELAMHDALTGLANRFAIGDVAPHLFALQDRGDLAGLALTTFDIDLFKNVNDHFGHPVGDQVLRRVARTLRQSIRVSDLAARTGGEEFAVYHVLGPDEPVEELANRVRGTVASLRFAELPDDFEVHLSAGVARRRPGEGFDSLADRADRALYEAKEQGRNCTRVAPDA
ncbi:MAG: diguanylate cyclase [Acidimicrobiia bacterium]